MCTLFAHHCRSDFSYALCISRGATCHGQNYRKIFQDKNYFTPTFSGGYVKEVHLFCLYQLACRSDSLWIISFFRKPSSSLFSSCGYSMNSGPGKEKSLTPLLKQLMPGNAMSGAISDGGSGQYKWQRQCISSFN